MDLSCAKYNHTDVLLCHDDELEGRRIAYILYLVPDDWEATDGGTLDLFSIDKCGQPSDIVASLVPTRNSLVFFEVTPISFHQVSEVLAQSKCRLSISGWFHGKTEDRPCPVLDAPPGALPAVDMEDDVLLQWVNPIYLDADAVASVQEQFEENSEAQLNDFLLSGKYEAVLSDIRSDSNRWQMNGPPNKRCFSSTLPSTGSNMASLVAFLRSKPMFKLLTKLTGLELADDVGDESCDEASPLGSASHSVRVGTATPTCSSRVCRWSHGNYTLAHDLDSTSLNHALDTALYFNCDDWDCDNGGFTSYVARGEDEELLTVAPSSNCLSLVYRDSETVRFVKFINDNVNRTDLIDMRQFYCVECTYKE